MISLAFIAGNSQHLPVRRSPCPANPSGTCSSSSRPKSALQFRLCENTPSYWWLQTRCCSPSQTKDPRIRSLEETRCSQPRGYRSSLYPNPTRSILRQLCPRRQPPTSRWYQPPASSQPVRTARKLHRWRRWIWWIRRRYQRWNFWWWIYWWWRRWWIFCSSAIQPVFLVLELTKIQHC